MRLTDRLYQNQTESRVIAHIDMNSYFATVEQQACPSLRGKPIGVSGKNDKRSIIAAASIEAKKKGVKTAMSTWEAKKICPNIILIPGDPEKYKEVTKKFLKIFERYTPDVEVFSIDEAFLDLSHFFNCHSGLDPESIDSRFRGNDKGISGNDKGMNGNGMREENARKKGCWLEAERIALEIKTAIKNEIGQWLTCSVGIAPNKMLSKLASDKQKPDGLVIVRPHEIQGFLKTCKLTDICGIAGRIERRLNMLGIKTVSQMGDFPEKNLVGEFGVYGKLLKLWGEGLDPSPVTPKHQAEAPKSTRLDSASQPRQIGHSYTLPHDTFDIKEVRRYLYILSDKVGRRARKMGFSGRTFGLLLRFGDFSHFYQRKTIAHATSDSYKIYKMGCKILEKKVEPKGGTRRSFMRRRAIRLVGISMSNLTKTKYTTHLLLPFDQKLEKSLEATDKINNRYGELTITRAEFMPVKLKVRVGGFSENEEFKSW